jgi:hypothetical protein
MLYYYEMDSSESTTYAAFFDKQSNLTSQLVVGGSSEEVPRCYRFVEQLNWKEDTIKRKIEYHVGNGGEESDLVEVVTRIAHNGSLTHTPAKITPL